MSVYCYSRVEVHGDDTRRAAARLRRPALRAAGGDPPRQDRRRRMAGEPAGPVRERAQPDLRAQPHDGSRRPDHARERRSAVPGARQGHVPRPGEDQRDLPRLPRGARAARVDGVRDEHRGAERAPGAPLDQGPREAPAGRRPGRPRDPSPPIGAERADQSAPLLCAGRPGTRARRVRRGDRAAVRDPREALRPGDEAGRGDPRGVVGQRGGGRAPRDAHGATRAAARGHDLGRPGHGLRVLEHRVPR